MISKSLIATSTILNVYDHKSNLRICYDANIFTILSLQLLEGWYILLTPDSNVHYSVMITGKVYHGFNTLIQTRFLHFATNLINKIYFTNFCLTAVWEGNHSSISPLRVKSWTEMSWLTVKTVFQIVLQVESDGSANSKGERLNDVRFSSILLSSLFGTEIQNIHDEDNIMHAHLTVTIHILLILFYGVRRENNFMNRQIRKKKYEILLSWVSSS